VVPPGFEFSESYLHAVSLIEKSQKALVDVARKLRPRAKNKTLAKIIADVDVSDGGSFSWFAHLVKKYGLMPRSPMDESASAENSEHLVKAVEAKVLQSIYAIKQYLDGIPPAEIPSAPKHRNKIASILSHNQSEVVALLREHYGIREFQVTVIENGKTVKLSPIEYAQRILKIDLGDFLTIGYDRDFGIGEIVKYSGSGIDPLGKSKEQFLNLDKQKMLDLVVASITDSSGGNPVVISADISTGVDTNSRMMAPRALSTRAKGAKKVEPFPHMMVITGVRMENGKVSLLRVENSYGMNVGAFGVYQMTPEFFLKKVDEIVVHRKYLDGVY